MNVISSLQNSLPLSDLREAGAPNKQKISNNTHVTCSARFEVKGFKIQNFVK